MIGPSRRKVLSVIGTRPEAIKFAPVLRWIERAGTSIQAVNVASGQHGHLLYSAAAQIGVRFAYRLDRPALAEDVCEIVHRLLPVLDRELPELILVQGDTSTALAGAIAGLARGIPVGHVEAGLRSGDLSSPFPEEGHRRKISRLATYHFAPTPRNREVLLHEGISGERIFVTGNPGVDSVIAILRNSTPSPHLASILKATHGFRLIILTTHRRESIGVPLESCFRALRRFVETHDDAAIVFPVHPNPALGRHLPLLRGHPRIHLTPAMDYPDFAQLMLRAWLIVSDSGGVQEEAPTLGKPLLILHGNTERPEAVDCGVARLAGTSGESLAQALEESLPADSWAAAVRPVENPFGRGDSGWQIARRLPPLLGVDTCALSNFSHRPRLAIFRGQRRQSCRVA